MSDAEVAWAAGLFEGEGCIGAYRTGGRPYYLQLQLCMTDEDVVRRFYRIVGVGNLGGPYSNGNRQDGTPKKLRWRWEVRSKEGARAVFDLLAPWLCERRLQQYADACAIVAATSDAAGVPAAAV